MARASGSASRPMIFLAQIDESRNKVRSLNSVEESWAPAMDEADDNDQCSSYKSGIMNFYNKGYYSGSGSSSMPGFTALPRKTERFVVVFTLGYTSGVFYPAMTFFLCF